MHAGTGENVIYVPGIGYVTPVNSPGTSASPVTATKGMAHLPMYGSPIAQGSSPATGGVTTQTGGQATTKTGTKKTAATEDAGTNTGDVQVSDSAGLAGANGGINSGTDLSSGKQGSTATGSNSGLSTNQGTGYTASGSKASGSKTSGSGTSNTAGTSGTETGRTPICHTISWYSQSLSLTDRGLSVFGCRMTSFLHMVALQAQPRKREAQ